MSLLRLREYDVNKNAAVTLFMLDNCKDKSGRFEAPSTPYDGTWKQYKQNELASHNVLANGVNSIMMPPNLYVAFYDQDNWIGEL